MTTPPPPQPITRVDLFRRMPTGGTAYTQAGQGTTHNEHRDQLSADLRHIDAHLNQYDNTVDGLIELGWRKQGAAHPDVTEQAAQVLCAEEVCSTWEDDDGVWGCNGECRSIAERFANAGLLAGQGAADDDTTRLRAELDTVEAENGRLTHRNNQLRAERDAFVNAGRALVREHDWLKGQQRERQARIDKALAIYDAEMVNPQPRAYTALGDIRSALTQVSQPQPAPAPSHPTPERDDA